METWLNDMVLIKTLSEFVEDNGSLICLHREEQTGGYTRYNKNCDNPEDNQGKKFAIIHKCIVSLNGYNSGGFGLIIRLPIINTVNKVPQTASITLMFLISLFASGYSVSIPPRTWNE